MIITRMTTATTWFRCSATNANSGFAGGKKNPA
jgi:hypothetical protein